MGMWGRGVCHARPHRTRACTQHSKVKYTVAHTWHVGGGSLPRRNSAHARDTTCIIYSAAIGATHTVPTSKSEQWFEAPQRVRARVLTLPHEGSRSVSQPRWKTLPVEPKEGRAGGATEGNGLVVPAVGLAGDAGKAVARLTTRTWPDASMCAWVGATRPKER